MLLSLMPLLTAFLYAAVTLPPGDPVEREFIQVGIDAPDQFNLVDVPCTQLLDDFTEKTGWTIEGDRPYGQCSFDAGRELMGFELAKSRLEIALSESTGGVIFWQREPNHTLEIVRLADICSLQLGLDRIFTSVGDFAQSSSEMHSWSLVLNRLRYGASERLAPYIDLLPSYVRLVPFPDKERPAVTILAATIDARLYCPLIDMLDIALSDEESQVGEFEDLLDIAPCDEEVRVAEIKLQFGEPDELVDKLHRSIGNVVEYQPLGEEQFARPEDSSDPLRVWSDRAHRRVVVAGLTTDVDAAQRIAHSMDDWKRLCIDVANSP